MTLKDYAGGVVLDEYKDENLDENFGPERVAKLRRVPPEQRQNVIAEMTARMYDYKPKVRHSSYSRMSMLVLQPVLKPDEIIEEILQENGW